jgi:transcriptional regulator with XRE-family HTH domain
VPNPTLPNTTDYERLGRVLRTIRRKASLTQRQLGEAIDLRSEFISSIERGRRGLRWHRLLEWLAACGSDLRELVDLLEADH